MGPIYTHARTERPLKAIRSGSDEFLQCQKWQFPVFLLAPIKRQSATTMSWNQNKSLWSTKMKICYHQQAKWYGLSFGIGKVPPRQAITSDLHTSLQCWWIQAKEDNFFLITSDSSQRRQLLPGSIVTPDPTLN